MGPEDAKLKKVKYVLKKPLVKGNVLHDELTGCWKMDRQTMTEVFVCQTMFQKSQHVCSDGCWLTMNCLVRL